MCAGGGPLRNTAGANIYSLDIVSGEWRGSSRQAGGQAEELAGGEAYPGEKAGGATRGWDLHSSRQGNLAHGYQHGRSGHWQAGQAALLTLRWVGLLLPRLVILPAVFFSPPPPCPPSPTPTPRAIHTSRLFFRTCRAPTSVCRGDFVGGGGRPGWVA